MRRLSILLFAAASLANLATAQSLVLVTQEEAASSQAAGGLLSPRNTPPVVAPRIELVAPDISKPVVVPTTIEIRFTGSAPAELKPETFRLLYGAFRIDVTQRLLGVTKVTKEGIKVREAVLPSGRHQFALSVMDTLGREVVQVISFTVQ